MPRAQNMASYINAAFLLKYKSDLTTISGASICYGGLDPNVSIFFLANCFITSLFDYLL